MPGQFEVLDPAYDCVQCREHSIFAAKHRSCRKAFPGFPSGLYQIWNPDKHEHPAPCWIPVYEAGTSQGKQMVELEDVGSPECPVSVMARHPEASAWVSDVLAALRVKESTGSFPGGMDSAKWSARWFDVVEIAFIEERRIEVAKEKMRNQGR